MALDDDLLRALEERIRASKERTVVVGTVQSVEPLSVVFDGASIAVPCVSLDDTNLAAGKRVCIARWGVDWVVIGALGNRVTHFPSYTATPTGTNPGDGWYRSDLNTPYININGVATPIITASAPVIYTEVLDVDFAFGTTIEIVPGLTIENVPAGKYRFQVDLDWTTTGTASSVDIAIDSSATIVDSQYKVVRYTSSAVVMTPIRVMGVIYATSTAVPQGGTFTGYAEFSTVGDFQVWIRRIGSTTGTLSKGSVVMLSPLTA
jgi:hypothetical protein